MNNKVDQSKQQLQTLATINDLVTKLFSIQDQRSGLYYLVNQTQELIPYYRSFILFKKQIIAANGGVTISPTAEIKDAIAALDFPAENGLHICERFIEDKPVLIVRLNDYYWLFEFPMDAKVESFKAAIQILAEHLQNYLNQKSKHFPWAKYFFAIVFISIITGSFFIKVPSKVISTFVVQPKEVTPLRAPIDGTILTAVKNRKQVADKSLLFKFDDKDLIFEKEDLLKKIKEFEIEAIHLQNQSYKDKSILIDLEIVKVKIQREKIALQQVEYQLTKTVLLSPKSGFVDLIEDHNVNRVVRRGEELGMIFDQTKLLAEIWLDQEDYGITSDIQNLSFYLHSEPDKELTGEIIEIIEKPTLTDNQRFSFRLKANIHGQQLHNGTTGVVHIKGKKVSLAYFLFGKAVSMYREL